MAKELTVGLVVPAQGEQTMTLDELRADRGRAAEMARESSVAVVDESGHVRFRLSIPRSKECACDGECTPCATHGFCHMCHEEDLQRELEDLRAQLAEVTEERDRLRAENGMLKLQSGYANAEDSEQQRMQENWGTRFELRGDTKGD